MENNVVFDKSIRVNENFRTGVHLKSYYVLLTFRKFYFLLFIP